VCWIVHSILANTEVLAVSDDPLGKEGVRLGDSGRLSDRSSGEIYVGPLEHGRFAVVMFNRNHDDAPMTLEEVDLRTLLEPEPEPRGGGGWQIRDLWAHTDNGTLAPGGSLARVVPGNDALMFTLTPSV
jgi:hypothetical protein